MRKTLCLLLILLFLPLMPQKASAVGLPTVSAKAAVVINGLTREIIYSKNEHQKLSMASTTKIMTSLLLIESGLLDDTYTVTKEALVEGSSIGLKEGDSITGKVLLAGMMLESGNDAATAAAIWISGSQTTFADKMNQKAKQIGMQNTNFVTPSGLDSDEHYSTAYDMALLAAAALEVKEFREISSTVSMHATYGTPQKTKFFYNHNKLLTEYDGAIGLKTGYTKKSGRCLVSAAEKDGKLIIVVTLSDPNDWQDHKNLLDYGMSQVESCDITYNGGDIEVAVVGSDISLVALAVPKRTAGLSEEEKKYITYKIETEGFQYAPTKAGQIAGKVYYYYKGNLIATDNLYIGGDTPFSNTSHPDNNFWRSFLLIFSFFK
ncbi:MAG: D-alanyl-D-alanine carboxypeptidase [Clostridia bacterium]|nr:D-alanyl-D-alanine carboxypeptidase [Clostridia bacterium]